MKTDTLTFNQVIRVDPGLVYRAFTNATALRTWLCNLATVVPRPGGRIYLWWESGYHTSGEYTNIVPGKEVSFSWFGKGEPSPTEVTVSFSPEDGGTLVMLNHKGIGSGEDWEKSRNEIKNGWKNALENLESVMTSGEDLRFIKRPMLGIILDELNAELAEKLGLPSEEGLRLGGTIAGMGAEAAGLKEDDVIIGMGGMQTVDFETLNQALNTWKAGDTIEVVYFRDGKQQSVEMTLSGRPIPDIPATAEELGKAVAEINHGIEQQLDEFLKGLDDAEASFKPAQSEWSIKEVLAHLIQGERGNQQYIAEVVGGYERFADDYGGNIDPFLEATIAAYPTVEDLFNEYHLNMIETVQFLSNLPDEFLARKGEYWQLAYGMLQDPYHFNTHLEQMQAALKAARAN